MTNHTVYSNTNPPIIKPIPSRLNIIVESISATCSQGKTYQTNNYISRFIYECNYIFIVPSIQLANQQSNDLNALGLNPTVIHGDSLPDDTKTVQENIINYFDTVNQDKGNILIITSTSYFSLKSNITPSSFKTFHDEVPKAYNTYRIFSEKLRPDFRKHFELIGDIQGSMQAIRPKNLSTFKSFIKRLHRTEFKQIVFDFLRDVANPNYDVYVHLGDYIRLVERKRIHKDDIANRIRFVSVLRPDAMRKTILLGNKISTSIIHSLMTNEGYQFNDFPVSLRPPIKNKIHIISAYQGRTSRTFFDADDHIVKMYGDINNRVSEPALFIGNNAEKKLHLNDNFTRISTSNRGLNHHQKKNILIFYASLNLFKEMYSCLADVGITRELLTNEYLEIVEQSLYRTSARNPDDDRDVYLYVPSHDIGELIKDRLQASTHECLNLFNESKVIVDKVKVKQQSRMQLYIDASIDKGFVLDKKSFLITDVGMTESDYKRKKQQLFSLLRDNKFQLEGLMLKNDTTRKIFNADVYVQDKDKFHQYLSDNKISIM